MTGDVPCYVLAQQDGVGRVGTVYLAPGDDLYSSTLGDNCHVTVTIAGKNEHALWGNVSGVLCDPQVGDISLSAQFSGLLAGVSAYDVEWYE